MANDHWQQIQKLFEQAVERWPDERSAFLAEACTDDTALRAEVESLLEHHEQATEDFMLTPKPEVRSPVANAGRTGETVDIRSPPQPAAGLLGMTGYEIIRELHGGGQGVVFKALQKTTKH